MANQQPTKSKETNLKKCIECGQDYESTNRTGLEQKYCSKSCRNRSGYKRREDNLYKKFSGQIQQTTMKSNIKANVPVGTNICEVLQIIDTCINYLNDMKNECIVKFVNQ